MWYFSWILGLGFAVLFAIANALWLESQQDKPSNHVEIKTPRQLNGEVFLFRIPHHIRHQLHIRHKNRISPSFHRLLKTLHTAAMSKTR